MKFFLMLLVYVVYLTWWASSLTTTVEAQTLISQKTVLLLDAHIKECKDKDIRQVRLEEDVKHLNEDVLGLLQREREKQKFKLIK
jgi:predicted transposase YbfD/YdcC